MSMPATSYILLVIGYLVVWLAIFLYVARLHVAQRRLSRRIETLESQFGKEKS